MKRDAPVNPTEQQPESSSDAVDPQAKANAELHQQEECCEKPGESSASSTDGLGLGPAFTMFGMLLFLAVIAGLFAFLKAISIPDLGKWFIFAACLVLIAGWWLISVGAADRRVKNACCSSKPPESAADRLAQQQFAEGLVKFAHDTHCSPEGAHFIADAIYFSPNYFSEDGPEEYDGTALSSSQVLLAVVRYAQDCFGDEAEQRMADWGFASREKLEFLIKELASRDLARLGTRGFSLDFGNDHDSRHLA